MRTLLTAVAAAALLTGCTQTVDDSTAQPETTTPATEVWDSCTLPDDVLVRAKLLPSTKDDTNYFDGWRMCAWDVRGEGWYYVGIYASPNHIDSYFKNPNKSDFREATVGGREGWTYTHELGIPARDQCIFVLPTGFGAIDFTAVKFSTRDHPEADMCDILLTHVEFLLPATPE